MKGKLTVNMIRNRAMRIAASLATFAMVGMTNAGTMMASAKKTASSSTSDVDLEKVTSPIIGLINNVLNVLIPLVAAVGAVFCITLGVKYSRAEEPQEREKAKQHLKSAIIGFVLVFVLIVALRLGEPILREWMNDAAPQSN